MNKKNMKRLTVMLVICTMLMDGIAMFPVSAEEVILPEAQNEESASVETVQVEEPATEEPVADGSMAEEPAVEKPAAEELVAEESAAEEPVIEELVVEEAAAEEPVVDVPTFDEPVAFSGELTAKLENMGDIIEGQQVILNATVLKANMDYSFQWQRTLKERKEDEEEIWLEISNILTYIFDATEDADDYFFRAVLTAKDGTTLYSEQISFDVMPAEDIIVDESETEETEEIGPADVDSTDVEDEPDDGETVEIEENETPLGIVEIVTLYTVDTADVRMDADEFSDILTTLDKGAAVTTVGQEGSWTRVVIGEQVGFVFSDLLIATLPDEEMETAAEEEPIIGTVQLPEKKVDIFSSRCTVMTEGDYVLLSSKIEGFDGLDIIYQWECDQGDGFRPVENANNDTYVFKASTESLSWNWRLTVYYR